MNLLHAIQRGFSLKCRPRMMAANEATNAPLHDAEARMFEHMDARVQGGPKGEPQGCGE
ncbi:MAG TPA: hypothetical protein VN662_08955 [Rhodanobacteraceae bacterium]|jgi:hypothetical protein|nr:hypothetical protein [Rhodanobacteraceae bacterium]